MLHVCVLICFRCALLFATPWTVARQALLSMGFSTQEFWSGSPCPPGRNGGHGGDLPDPGIKSASLTFPAMAGRFFTSSAMSESCSIVSDSLRPMDYSPWNSPGQNTGVGSHSFLQGIFPTQGLNPGLLHC